MIKPVARLVTAGAALALTSAALLVVSANALDSISVDRAELDDGLLRLEGEDAVPFSVVWVTSLESSASGQADDDGRFRLLVPALPSVVGRGPGPGGGLWVTGDTRRVPPAPPPDHATYDRIPDDRTADDERTADLDDDHHHHDVDHDAADHDHDDNDATDDDDHVHHLHDHDGAAADDHDDADDHRAADAGDVHRSPRPRPGAVLQRGAHHSRRGVCAHRDRVRSRPGDVAEPGVHRGDDGVQPAERERHVHGHRHG
jgi:hypothetical protein